MLSNTFQTKTSSILNQTSPFQDAISCISTVNFSGQELIAMTAWDGSIRICRLLNIERQPQLQQLVFGRYQPTNQCAFNTKGNRLYFSDIFGTVNVYDLQKLKSYQILSLSNNAFCSLSVDQDDKHLFMTTFGKNAYRYKLNENQKCNFKNVMNGNSKFIKSVSKGNYLFCLNSKNNLNCFSINGWKSTKTQIQWSLNDIKSHEHANTMAISSNLQRIAVGKVDGTIGIGDLCKKGEQGFILKNEFSWFSNRHEQNQSLFVYGVNCLQFSSFNKNILAIGLSDGSVCIYDVENRKPVHMIDNNGIPVTSIKFSSDGQFLIYSIGDDFHKGQFSDLKYSTSVNLIKL